MKKKFLLIMACIGFCTALNAQNGLLWLIRFLIR